MRIGLNILKSNYVDEAHAWVVMIALVMLPLAQQYLSIILILLIALFFIRLLIGALNKQLIRNPFLLASFGFMMLYLAGSVKSFDNPETQFDYTQKASVFFIGLLTLNKKWLMPSHLNRLKRGFIFGNILALVICLVMAVLNFAKTGNTKSFFYSELSFFMHTSYFAMYLCFSIAMILQGLFDGAKLLKSYWLSFGCITFFSTGVILLDSKTGIITLLLISAMYAFKFLASIKIKTKHLLILAIIIFTLGILISTNQSSRFSKIIADYNAIDQPVEKIDESTEGKRVYIWKSAIEVIKENLWLGTGVGNDNQALANEYNEKGYFFLAKKNLNAHNQYLQVFMTLGIAGFIFFVAYSILPLYYGIRHKDLLIISFAVIMIVNMLTESVLNRQAGIIFWTIWGTLLLSDVDKLKNATSKESRV
jgi:O-antigen ligase